MDSSYDSLARSPNSPLLDHSHGDSIFIHDRSQLSSSSHGSSVSIFTRAVVCILVTELCERLTYYGISGNLQLFASDENQLDFQPNIASIIAYIFQGTCFLLPVLGGWLADTLLGKFSVIFFSTIIYLVGAIMLPLASISKDDKHVDWAKASLTTSTTFKRVIYLCGLTLVAFGTGGIKANVSPFGAEQISREGVERFFMWFYWFINIGAILAFTFVVYVQQNVSYFYGYLIPTCSIVITLVIFVAGKPSYHIQPPAGSVLTTTVKIVAEAARSSRHAASRVLPVNHWLDRAKVANGGSYTSWEVEDVKKVYRLLPIFSTFILYWTVYAQMNTSMVYQGEYMDIHLTSSFQIPIASLSVLDTIAVLTCIPIMAKIVYPLLLAKCNIELGRLKRIGIGMVIATLSMVCAGGIELYRKDHCCVVQSRPPNDVNVTRSNITIFYQVPQYALIGLSEVFTSVTGLELAYAEAPKSLQGVIMGVFLLTTGLGTYLGAAVVAVVNAISGRSETSGKWYPDRKYINNGKLAYYFFLLAGVMALNFVLYIFVAVSFNASKNEKPRRKPNPKINTAD